MRAIRRFTVRTTLPESLAPLGELSTNLRWSWHPATRALFAAVDPQVWDEVERDPVRLLGAVAPERLQALAADEDFTERVRQAHGDLQHYLTAPRWYQHLQAEHAGSADAPPAAIGYFSPEYGITAARSWVNGRPCGSMTGYVSSCQPSRDSDWRK